MNQYNATSLFLRDILKYKEAKRCNSELNSDYGGFKKGYSTSRIILSQEQVGSLLWTKMRRGRTTSRKNTKEYFKLEFL